MPKISLKLTHEGRTEVLEVARKANLLRSIQESGIPIGSACGGNGLCASCKVNVLKGEKNLSTPNDIEVGLSVRNQLQSNERIACQTKVMCDVEITTSYW